MSLKYLMRTTYLSFLLTFFVTFTSCVQRERVLSTQFEQHAVVKPQSLNINTASLAELEKLPRIGEVTARKITEFREKYGKFHRIEDIMLIDKMSEKHFREIRDFIKAD